MIIQGSALTELKKLDSESVDLLLTDPPYNAKDIGPNKRKYSMGQMCLPLNEYIKFCGDWFNEAQRVAKTIIFTPGIANTHNYPQPKWQICWHKPAAVSFNRMGGFNAWEPIFIYGYTKKVRCGQDYIKCNTLNFTKGVERDHPCPKPKNLWGWIIRTFTKEKDFVVDPFAGSGTTAVVCEEYKRRYLCIDINLDYIKMAEKRIQNTEGILL